MRALGSAFGWVPVQRLPLFLSSLCLLLSSLLRACDAPRSVQCRSGCSRMAAAISVCAPGRPGRDRRLNSIERARARANASSCDRPRLARPRPVARSPPPSQSFCLLQDHNTDPRDRRPPVPSCSSSSRPTRSRSTVGVPSCSKSSPSLLRRHGSRLVVPAQAAAVSRVSEPEPEPSLWLDRPGHLVRGKAAFAPTLCVKASR